MTGEYYRVWYKNYQGETVEYARGLTLDEAQFLISQLAISGFMAWYEAE